MTFVTINFDFTKTYCNISEVMLPVSLEKYNHALELSSQCEINNLLFSKYFVMQDTFLFRDFFKEAAEQFSENRKYSRQIAEAYIQLACLKLSENEQKENNGIYRRAIKFIDENYALIKQNKDVSDVLGYHPYYLNSIFKKVSGMTLHQYILDVRLKKGAEALIKTSNSISEIAYNTGFENPNHFSKRFSEKYGIPPTSFRNRYV